MLNKMLNKIYFALVLIVLPVFAFAQNLSKTTSLLGSVKIIVTDYLIPIAFTLALLFFFWGVAKYIWSEGQAKAEGKQIMIWGVVALFVMASVWGLVSFIQSELLGGTNPTNMPIPTIGGSSSSI